MQNKELDNLVKIGQLKQEPFSQSEFDTTVRSGNDRLQDACSAQISLSGDGRFAAVTRRAVTAADSKSAFQLRADTLEVVRELTFPLAGDLHCVAYALTAAVGTGKGQFAIWDVE